MARSHRIAFAAFGVGFLGLLASVSLGQIAIQIQPGNVVGGPIVDPDEPNPKSDAPATSQFSAVKRYENPEYRRYINVARDAMKDKDWDVAVTALQKILDTHEDFAVQVREKDVLGREVVRWTSVKYEAQTLLGSMPDEGLDVYEQRFGGRAAASLKEAKDAGDRERLAEVAHKWFHTRAGAEANDLLATLLLDRGDYFLAAQRFERGMKLASERFAPSDLTLFKAALAFRRAGDARKSGELWRRFEEKVEERDGLRVGDRTLSLAKLRTVFHDDKRPIALSVYDWPMPRGNLANNALASGSPPLLDQPLWVRSLLKDNDPNIDESRYHDSERLVEPHVNAVLGNANNHVAIPGFFPISTGGRLIVRAYGELRCIALSSDIPGAKPGDTLWRSTDMDGSLNKILQPKKEAGEDLRDVVQPWLTNYVNFPGLPGFGNLIFENTTLGAITTDHQNVYAIDDLAIPSPDNQFHFNPFMGVPRASLPPKIRPYVMQNCLYAFNLQEGRAAWVLGSFHASDPKDEFTDSHFLGAPIGVGGKLYVLNEKHAGEQGDAELRLICIDPNKIEKGRPHIVRPIQILGSVDQRNRVTHAIARRVNGVHLAYGEGILVCPTNAGEILGVDLMSRSLAWAYPYRERSPEERMAGNPNLGGRPFINPVNPSSLSSTVTVSKWKAAPPAIVDGKVVFTAPDADSVHCVNVHDGSPRWKVGRLEGDLFFAGVVDKKVLLVGKNHVRALNLDDGRPLWSVTTGDYPSGYGVASGGVYYQPLKKAEILAIDVVRGAIKAHNRAKNAGETLGNLMFSDGSVVAVSPRKVVAYPQLLAKLEVADAALKNDPNNPEKLISRGEILLADGQVQRAVDDLQLALQQKVTDAQAIRARDRLYDALTDLLQADFPTASEKYLDDYRQLCQLGDTPREKQLRQARYYRIVGHGREVQGNLIEAFSMYKEFGSLPIHRETGGVASLDDPSHKVPVDVWLRGRVSSMFARATPEQRAPLEAKIAEEWRSVEARKDLDAIRAFVGMFDTAFAVGREARLRLAQSIVENDDRGSFLEAEMNLYQLRGTDLAREPSAGGRALAALAALEEKRGTAESMQAAALFYRQLAGEFPDAAVRGAKTGRDLFNELEADKRLLPYVEDSSAFWNAAPLAAREFGGVGLPPAIANQQIHTTVLRPDGEPSPFLARHRLVLETAITGVPPKLSLVDVETGKNRWGPMTLGGLPMNMQVLQVYHPNYNSNLAAHPNARFRMFGTVGRLAVVQVGVAIFCVELEQGRILWQHSLFDPIANNPIGHTQLMVDAEGYFEMLIWNQNGQQRSRRPVGHVAAVQPNYVAVVGDKGLQVFDPVRGNVLWKKADVSSGSRAFGDDQHIFVVEMGEGGTIASTRTLRASDGEPVAAPGFVAEYQNRLRILGRRILTTTVNRDQKTLRLYDPLTGKDVWSKPLDARAIVATTEDPSLTGWVEPTGRFSAIDAETGNELLNANALQGRIGLEDIANLREPLLLADDDRFYLALNRSVDGGRVGGAVVGNNFQGGLRGRVVNGYVLAFHRRDGKAQLGRDVVPTAKGQLAWHTYLPVENQMIVTEQFERMPILLFTARFHKLNPGGASAWLGNTIAVHKQTGRAVYVSQNRPTHNNSVPMFVELLANPRQGSIAMIGHSHSVQFYIDDGRKIDLPKGVSATSAVAPANVGPGVNPGIAVQIQPGVIIRRPIPIAPAPNAQPVERD